MVDFLNSVASFYSELSLMWPAGRSCSYAAVLMAALAGQDQASDLTINVECETKDAILRLNESTTSYQCSNNDNWVPQPINAGVTTVNVMADKLTLELQTSSVAALNFFAATGAPSLALSNIDLLNFENFGNLKSLTFRGVVFEPISVNLILPNSTTDLHIIDSALSDLSLPDYSDVLTNIELSNTLIDKFPKFLYERKLNPNMGIDVNLSTITTTTTLTAPESSNLDANAKAFSTQAWAIQLRMSCPTQALYQSISAMQENGSTVILCALQRTSASDGILSTPQPADSNGFGSANLGNSSSDVATGTSIAIMLVILAIAVALALIILRTYYKHKCAGTNAQNNDTTATLMSKGEVDTGKGSFISNDDLLRNFRLPQSDVSTVKSWGSGRLWLCEYRGKKVMVKRVESEVTDSYVTKALIVEARTLSTISHPNITNLLGVTWLAGTDFAVVTEFMAKGDLKTVLTSAEVDLDISAKLSMCFDVASALAYLHETERILSVKQLSSRKVLINEALDCKLSLFECVPSTDNSRGPITYGLDKIVWLPPEIITRSSPMDARKHNIYAFGVLASEILTRTAPYKSLIDKLGNTMSDIELVSRVRRQDPLRPHENRQEFSSAPAIVRQLIEQCLSYAPMSRPTARDLVKVLSFAKNEVTTISL
ncbi:hypothetical protein CCR75_002319 [Bremia lactucae]|uniref:Protein kinase domain-containing protein n=1 Tax=Bremia lactucae TaxID=4779 RepID=A0A976IK19_BRELC|nr:hypothetical protein CCR75_002319 [Bremia lactucae]